MRKLIFGIVSAVLLFVAPVVTSAVRASSSADLTVSSFALTDKSGNVKTTFAPNEPIYVRYSIKNSGTQTAFNQYASTGNIWSQVYGNKPTTVATNTESDVSIWTRNQNNIQPSQVITYNSTPTGTNTVAFEGQHSWTESTVGTYTARVFVNYDHLAQESNYTNNQAAITYKIATSQPTPTPTPKPTATPTPTPVVTTAPTATPTPVPPSDHIIATCTNGVINMSFPVLPAGSTSWAIRIDNTTMNGWGGDTPNPGDAVVNNYTGSTYAFTTNPGSDITWWVHSISSNGVYSDPTVGQLYCGLAAPTKLTYTHSGTNVTLSWSTVPGAAMYALRIDDTTTPWDPSNMQPGDHIRSSWTATTFTFTATPGHKYVWWVHARDSQGRYSDPTISSFMLPISKPTGLSASYSWPYATLTWSPVNGAKYYAIRVDNTMNGWNNTTMNEGDYKVDNLTTTSFKVDVAPGRKLVWWVHAIDVNGNYSDAAVQEYYVPGN